MNVLDTFKLDGKTAVVTGGGGLYGRQVVEAVAEAGAKTFAAGFTMQKEEKTAEKLRSAGWDVTAVQYDQGSEESIQALLDTVVKQAGRVDVLVNNAVVRPMKSWDSPTEDFIKSMKVNATGLYLMTRLFGNHMAERGGGSIVNIGSIHGMIAPDFTLYEGLGWGAPPDYFFHKGGMLQLTRYAASTLGPMGVRVNVISPGGFFNHQEDIFVQRYNKRTLLGRMADETDLKGAVVFLASDASSYVTGANLVVDAGYTVK
ncbi:MAG: SDR family oxidoreductase [Phycisphaerae bacterium]|nr:SDR family oxidoreductase [Phycisphaerae bacterium]